MSITNNPSLKSTLNGVLHNINQLSDEQLMNEFNSCYNGAVGRAVMEGYSWIEEELERRHCAGIRVWLDHELNKATFMLHGIISNKILGYQTYNPSSKSKKTNDPEEARYYTYQPSHKVTGEYAVFGLEYIENRGTLFVTEGIFEATRLIGLGFDAIAILTSNPPKNLITQLHTITDNIIWCGDNDKAGKSSRLAKYPHLVFDKDLDEVEEKELISAIKELTNLNY